MLTENDIVELVCKQLRNEGYEIDQQLDTSQTGIDIIATAPNAVICAVEAKGATSSKVSSSRFGKEFNLSQVKTHVGAALVAAFKVKNDHPDWESIVALPDNLTHRGLIANMRIPIVDSGIKVWLVSDTYVDKFI